MQPWAGAAWGHQFIPRVGMEVVVTFEGGDPDKPMVIGAVPNGTHPSPFILPDDKTRSGWRTQSSPGGGGYNELSFEDAADDEQIRLVAQRDLDETVNNNHTRSVTHSERVSVGRNRTLTVGGALNEVVEESATHTVKGARAVKVEGTENKTVTGDTTTVAKAQMTIMVQGVYGLTVGTTDADATAFTDVHGDYKLGASKTVRLVATQALQIVCGESIIEVKPDEIRIEAKALTLVGKQSVSVEGKGPTLSLTDEAVLSSKTLTLKGSEGLLKLDSGAEIQGQTIKLNKPRNNTTDPSAGSVDTKSFRVNVHDDFDKPLASKPYRLLVEGKELDGTTDGDGLVEQDVSPSAASAHLTVWLVEKEKDPKIEWQISLADLPPVETPQGVRRRLQNLGYYRVGTGQTDADADAIRAFQKDQGTDVTGILDDALRSVLDGLQGA